MEKQRYDNEFDFSTEIYQPFSSLRVMPCKIDYPDVQEYPEFYERTNLMHLCELYRPDNLK